MRSTRVLVSYENRKGCGERERTGWVADGVPVRGGIVKEAFSDLVRQIVREVCSLQLVREGGETAEADVKHHAQRPDVNGLGVLACLAALDQDLRCHIAGRAAERGREGRLSHNLGEAEIANLDSQVVIHEQDVLGLDIPVNHVAVMLRSLSALCLASQERR
jgi:hypothetical protein